MKVFFGKALWIVLTSIFFALFVVLLVATIVCNNFFAAVNMVLKGETYKLEHVGDADSVYFSSDYVSDKSERPTGEQLLAADKSIIEEVVGEGATLLWNKQAALPLAANSKVSCINKASVDIVETGTGSGYIASDAKNSATLRSALEAVGVTVNLTLYDFYKTGAGKSYNRTNKEGVCQENATLSVNEVPWGVYTDPVKDSFAAYGDAAIVVISRTGGEYSDHRTHGVDTPNKNYLQLTTAETGVLDQIAALRGSGTFKKTIVLINSGNQLEMNTLLGKYYDSIDACMWIGEPGMFGMNSIAKLLVADGMIPSGHLPDTYCYDNTAAPATANDGDHTYTNGSRSDLGANAKQKNRYMVYQEGIYVGYKYFETRYEDLILGTGNADAAAGVKNGAGVWDYASEVAFPFGHGESYTTFAYSDFKVTVNRDGDYEVSVRVTNTGTEHTGKDAVQIYLQKPYTTFDKENKLEQSAVELVGYAKTEDIAPGGHDDVTVTVSRHEFKTYDNAVNETYILEGGDYYLTAAQDAHAAVNNILAKKGYSPAQGMDAAGDAALVDERTLTEDLTTFAVSQYGEGAEIANRLDFGDINRYAGKGDQSVTYLSRRDWSATYPTKAAALTMTDRLVEDVQYDKAFDTDETAEMPTYGKPFYQTDENGEFILNDDGEKKIYNVTLLMGRGYDDELWGPMLDQMTWEEQARLCANAYHQTELAQSIGLPGARQENGPVGITKRSDFSLPEDAFGNPIGAGWTYVSYPCGPLMGATFNDGLIERMGEHMSEDMLFLGYNGIYGPGANLHRTAYGGRNWEYPSECEFLTGKICAAEIRGIQKKGCLAFVKHYALNDLETNRRHVSIWSNEQVSREIYLRAFEYAFTEGGALATMNSFTRVGPIWCGASSELLVDILRGEWDFEGIVITDWDSGGTMSKIDALLGGTNSWDGNNDERVYAPYKDDPMICRALRESAKRIIYTTLKTNAMNGIAPDTKVVPILTWWQVAFIAGDIVTGALALLAGGMLTFVLIKQAKTAKQTV